MGFALNSQMCFFFIWLLILWLFGDLGPVLMYVCQCFSLDAALRRRCSRHRASRSGFTLLVFASLTGLAETNKHHTPTLIPHSMPHKKNAILAVPKHTRHYRLIRFFSLLLFPSIEIPGIVGEKRCATWQLKLKTPSRRWSFSYITVIKSIFLWCHRVICHSAGPRGDCGVVARRLSSGHLPLNVFWTWTYLDWIGAPRLLSPRPPFVSSGL